MAESIGQHIIVIEGMGGSGKTTAAQILASRYGLSNFNTGTLFRATAATMLHQGISLAETAEFVEEASYDIDTADALRPYIAVDGLDVSDLLQLPEITRVSSHVGQINTAAARLERIFYSSLHGSGDMVVEGKHLADRIGAVASSLFFFTADLEIRAHRKWGQAQQSGRTDYTPLQALLDTRANDLRDKNLLTVPENTRVIDTSTLTPIQVVRAIAHYAHLE